jgi:hypothetical protein
MSGLLGARDRRALTVGIAFVVCAITGFRVLPAIRSGESQLRAELAEVRQAIASARAHADLLRTSGTDVGEGDEDPLLDGYSARTPTEGASALGLRVTALAEYSGARVHAVIPSADSAFTAGLAEARLRVSLTTDTRGLLDLIRELELASPLILVHSLTVDQGEPAAPREIAEALRVELGVGALIRRAVAADTVQ